MAAKLMGILNTTTDSFYEKSRFFDRDAAIQHGLDLWKQGADILDIGGESSRPNAPLVPEDEELRRVIPVIKELKQSIPIPISIDTVKVKVAEAALNAGASLINDITGFRDPDMQKLAASTGCDICVMHMQGIPSTMQLNPTYPEGVIPHLIHWFSQQIDLLLQAGVKEKQIILDPGIGFGKTIAHNLEIIDNLHVFKATGFPVLIGISRKSFMGKILGKIPAELLTSTIAMNAVALRAGVDIIRVHDVEEHRNLIKLMDCLDKKNV